MFQNEVRLYTHTISQEHIGVRLDLFLSAWVQACEATQPLAGKSRSYLQKMIETGHVLVNQKTRKSSYALRLGDFLTWQEPPLKSLSITPEPMPLAILYEDKDIIAINKPAGLAVHPGAGLSSGTLVHGLLAHCSDLSGIGGVLRPGIVHRLDRGTSGVLLVAKNDHAHINLAKQFSNRLIAKHYKAFVYGRPQKETATLRTFYARHPTHRTRFTSLVSSGKIAITHYSLAYHAYGISLLDIQLETGRTHQIRVHLSEHGHPILGDLSYQGLGISRDAIKHDALRGYVHTLTHQALHAQSISFTHPRTGLSMTLTAPWGHRLQNIEDMLSK